MQESQRQTRLREHLERVHGLAPGAHPGKRHDDDHAGKLGLALEHDAEDLYLHVDEREVVE